MTYDHPTIAAMRDDGMTWAEIAGRLGTDPKRVRQAHGRWCQRQEAQAPEERMEGGTVLQKWLRTPEGTYHVRMPRMTDLSPETMSAFWDDALDAFSEWQPRKEPPPIRAPAGDGLAVLSIYDAHFGMRADSAEVGMESQDLSIISDDFRRCGEGLVSLSRVYSPSRYLIPLGHDFSHVNQYVGKTMTTRNGTEQDVDTRLWKIHRAVCESSIHLIDTARSTGRPVDVVMVPGNHDPDENFKLGEFLTAWYRFDDGVTITNTPTQHKYYGWESNSFMLTHGEHYLKTGAPNPINIFAAECPPDIWARGYGKGRFILSGHLHARKKGRYTPTSDVTEEHAITTYVLPGLTATDDWHYRMGYRHARAATLQVYRPEGGLNGHHEVSPH